MLFLRYFYRTISHYFICLRDIIHPSQGGGHTNSPWRPSIITSLCDRRPSKPSKIQSEKNIQALEKSEREDRAEMMISPHT